VSHRQGVDQQQVDRSWLLLQALQQIAAAAVASIDLHARLPAQHFLTPCRNTGCGSSSARRQGRSRGEEAGASLHSCNMAHPP
jgi:succinate dehydrogenase/fumarate reductase-like Fe-S protein